MGEAQLTQSEEDWLKLITTTYKRNFFRNVILGARPENKGLVPPEGVEWYRNYNFLEQQVAEHETRLNKLFVALKRSNHQLSKLLD